MTIGVCGYNSTGSSAVLDLLKEYDENQFIEEEFSFLFLPDGLSSLDYAVAGPDMFFSGDVGVTRFLTFADNYLSLFSKECVKENHAFIDRLIQTSWVGNSCFDATRRADFPGAFIHSPDNDRKMYLAHNISNFNELAQEYVQRLLEILGKSDTKHLIVNQMFSAANPAHTMKYVKDAKAIVVNRDPRDVYIIGKEKGRVRCYPTESVEKYVEYCKHFVRNSVIDTTGNTLYLRFEDLLFHYDATVNKIETFCGVHKHSKTGQYFSPNKSKNNVQLFYRFPKYKEDIEYIEKQLPDMIYHFTEPPIVTGDFF